MHSTHSLLRYSGLRVVVQTYGRQRVLGTLAAVDDDSIRLVDSRLQNDDVEFGWFDRISMDSDEMADTYPETIVPASAIATVTSFDDPPFDAHPDESVEKKVTLASVTETDAPPDEDEWNPPPDCDPVIVELGAGLIPLADQTRGGELLERIVTLRRQLEREIGFRIPKIRVRDNLSVELNGYRFCIAGSVVEHGTAYPSQFWVSGDAITSDEIVGVQMSEPLRSLPGLWIEPDQRERAEAAGLNVVEPDVLVIAHLAHTLRKWAAQILSVDEMSRLLKAHGVSSPESTTGMVPDTVSQSRLHEVLRSLLEEGVGIRFLPDIVSAIARAQDVSRDTQQIIESVRCDLGHQVVANRADEQRHLSCLAIGQNVLHLMNDLEANDPEGVALFRKSFTSIVRIQNRETGVSVVVTSPEHRVAVSGHLRNLVPDVIVVSHDEIPVHCDVCVLGTVTGANISDAMSQMVEDRSNDSDTRVETSPSPATESKHGKSVSGTRITSNVASLGTLQNREGKANSLSSALERLSTGLNSSTSNQPQPQNDQSDQSCGGDG